jgi:L-threonylcarbamoyladenylate synthase
VTTIESPRLEAAVADLRLGRLVVLPTDTVYGIGALPKARGGIARIFEVKGRPTDKPLPVLAAHVDDLAEVVELDARARSVGKRFWPGPLTVVLPRAPAFPFDVGGPSGAEETIAVRVPKHPLARALLELTGPLAVTSANRSGEAPATTAEEARTHFGDFVAHYLDGGRCAGEVSTLLSLVGKPRVLRPGAIPERELL